MDIKTYERIVQKAVELFAEHTTEVEIDTAPATSVGDDGTWVSAWVFIPKDLYEEGEEDEVHVRSGGRRV